MTIGELIKHHRRSQIPTMSKQDLAELTGLQYQYIVKLEKNRANPRYDLAIKILKQLGVDTKHPLMEV